MEHAFRAKRGVAALPTMLLIGGIVIEIAIAGAFLAFVFISSNLSAKLNATAVAVARAGVQDAMLRIVRDKGYSNALGYTLTVGSYSAAVTVTAGSPIAGEDTIISTATVLTRQKSFQAVVSVDSTTGEVRLVSFTEIPV